MRIVLQRKPCKHYHMSNKTGFSLLKHSHFPAITLVPPSSNMSRSSPFSMHSYFLSIVFQSLEVFCGSLLMGVVSWMSSHHSCLLALSLAPAIIQHIHPFCTFLLEGKSGLAKLHFPKPVSLFTSK